MSTYTAVDRDMNIEARGSVRDLFEVVAELGDKIKLPTPRKIPGEGPDAAPVVIENIDLTVKLLRAELKHVSEIYIMKGHDPQPVAKVNVF